MKKMGFIKSMWTTILGRTSLLALVLFCMMGQNQLNAQVVAKYDKDGKNTCTVEQLASCGGTVDSGDLRFTDDGLNDGNYKDTRMRRDTVEICPKDAWHRVSVVFTDFDLHTGDSLLVFDGNKDSVRVSSHRIGIGSGTGVGVPQAFGGWVKANCNPRLNPSGCLTFLLKTNGDNNKGSGWDAWVDCEVRKIEIKDVTIADKKLKCDDDIWGTITIPIPEVELCGTPAVAADGAALEVSVTNQHGEEIATALYVPGATVVPLTKDFAIGQYKVTYTLRDDKTKKREKLFSVQAPALVCNDELNVPLGAACAVTVRPDDVLEQPCDTGRYMQYNITVRIPGAHGFKDVVVKTTGHDGMGGVVYPMVTKEDIKKAGLNACDVLAHVKVERIYYGDRDGDGEADFPMNIAACNNGAQSLECGSVMKLKDVDAPWIDIKSAPDTVIACDASTLAKMVTAAGIDNCDDEVSVSTSIRLSEDDPCFASKGSTDTTTAIVTFTATDACGNVGSLTKEITVIRPNVNDPQFVAKAKDVKVQCDEAGPASITRPGVRIGEWKNGALVAKTIDTVYLSTEEYICGYILTSEEEEIPSTDCGKKKYVYHSVIDWCHSEIGPSAIDTTFIEYLDTKAPKFDEGEGEALDIELDHFSCTYDIHKLPRPGATDNCDANPMVRIDRVARIEDGKKWTIPGSEWSALDCDSFSIRWIVEDDCHEQLINDTLYQTVVIKDVTKPSAACVDQLNVSIPNEWGARVYVDDIDAGSYDACGIKTRQIRIKGSGAAWADYVDIGCGYVHPDLQLEMRVTDKKGNENICWLDVLVEDKINPYCEPLADKEGYCDEYHNGELGASTDVDEDFEMEASEWVSLEGDLLALYNAKFGHPACEDNLKAEECGQLEYEQQYQLIEWPCGELKAKRRYRAKDWSGNYSNWAEQKIVIKSRQNWKITFPADWEGECGDMAPSEQIVINNGPCDLLGYEVTEKQFEVPGDACFKIERTYHVINWCKYVAGDDPVELARVEGDHGIAGGLMVTSEGNEEKGYWTYVQVLKVHDDEAPVVTIINPEPCINGVDYDALPYGEEDQTPGAAPYECDEVKTWTATATDCSSSVTWEGRLYDANTGTLLKTVYTNELSYVVTNKDSYFAEFWAFDGCSNSGGAKGDPIKFWDCKKPTPYVLNGVAVELMEVGMVQVWATDLNQNSFDNCTDQSKLDFRIWADFLGAAPTDLAGVQSLGKVITFDCDRVGTNVVYIYVIDEEGNWDFAQTYVIVQDNMRACDSDPLGGMVAGRIVNPLGEHVEAVTITVAGGAAQSATTGADGYFQFDLATGADYTVTPRKDINPLNGVSTFDLVLISKHILGITSFDSPYKYIAADINKSGTITAFDMVQLRQLILNITAEFPANDSWRFVDAGHDFASANPASEDFAEYYNITALSADMMNMDFVGVKVGDVNGNANANSLLGASSRTVSGTFNLTAQDRFVTAGESVTVAFGAAEAVQGYQFTMNYAGTDGQITEGVAKEANFNTSLAPRGVITASWNGEGSTEGQFALSFTTSESGLLSEMVSISSDITRAEAYNEAGELMNVSIDFAAATVAGFELGQNTPNPFAGQTVIGFNLPAAGKATVRVMDAQGKVIKQIANDYAKGYNQVSLSANELGATGVLYYQLESADNVATKKMIIIE